MCRLFFPQHGALAIKQLRHRVLDQRSSTSHPVGSEGLDDAQEVFSRAQPVSQVVQPCTERLSRAMRRRCNASSKREQMSNSRTGLIIARGPWRLRRVWDEYPSALIHLGHLRKGLQQQVSPTTSRIMRNNPTRPCLSL